MTLALSEVTRLIIVALRDQTGGSLGATPNTALAQGNAWSLSALQFTDKMVWFYIVLAFWLAALWVWARVDRSMTRIALEAISQEEDAAASIGINVTRSKLLRHADLGGDDQPRRRALRAVPDLHQPGDGVRASASRCRWCSASSPAACT